MQRNPMARLVLTALAAVFALALTSQAARAVVVQFQVGQSADDAELGLGDGIGSLPFYNNNSSTLELGFLGQSRIIGLRFPAVSIPAGASILSASIDFRARSTESDPTQLTIFAENTGDALPYPAASPTLDELSARARTAAQVVWDVPPWSLGDRGPAQTTPDLTPLVQEVLGRGDWQSGNAMAFLFFNNLPDGGARPASSYDDGASRAPILTMVFALAAAPEPGTLALLALGLAVLRLRRRR